MVHIRLRDVTVEFPIYQGGSRSLKRSIVSGMLQKNMVADGRGRINVLALNGISIDLREGDRLGIIGSNGAGKSTLLRVMAGIFEPMHGLCELEGRVAALLTASVGLDMDATGRENISMRGMYQDIHPDEMRSKVDEIAEFTELGAYLDMPVRTYSSGMMVRLCFAAATSFPSDILLLDEWLSVGDARFLGKAQKRMDNFVSSARILVLASHSMPLLQQWCDRAILLDRGRIVHLGPVSEVAEIYQEIERAPVLVG